MKATAGSGGIGSVPSSRLTKILQEKAALLKKQREGAETALHEVQEQVRQLDAISVDVPEMHEREAQLLELARKGDWGSVETQGRALRDALQVEAVPAFEAKRQQIADRGERLLQFGLPLPEDFSQQLTGLAARGASASWADSVASLTLLDGWIRSAQTDFAARLRQRAREFSEWAGLKPGEVNALEGKLKSAIEPASEGKFSEAIDRVNAFLRDAVPTGIERHTSIRDGSAEVLGAGRDLGVQVQNLETALQSDAESTPLDWPKTVAGIEKADAQLADALRDRVGQVVQALLRTLDSLREYEVDATAARVLVEEAGARVPTASAVELPKLLTRARSATEEPVVTVVASLLDAVRPKLVEVRRLGRDPSEVFAAMNRAREALRLKIYSEALAASQEAIDRVGQLTNDLDAARGEVDSLAELLRRLATTRFPTHSYEETLDRARAHLERVELDKARDLIAKTIRSLGAESVGYFSARLTTLERVLQVARERAFLPVGSEEVLAQARQLLDDGQLADAGELAATLEANVRNAAGPYVARRVEELEAGFQEIPEEGLVAPVKRLLADADVNLRVKEDLAGSLDSLRRAEREFSAVFAAHASTMVEMLEEERRALEAMGGTGDEIQRQIDEVQQIFNMGDFVKASRTSQEIRTRAQQQQLVRSEEAVSHAKLSLVELGKMGLEAGGLKSQLEAAQEASRDRKYAEAYRLANAVEEGAVRTKERAQEVLDAMGSASNLWQTLKESGIGVEAFREQLHQAKTAYQALNFDAAIETVSKLQGSLTAARADADADRLSAEVQLLREDAQRLSLSTEPFQDRMALVARALSEHRSKEAAELAAGVHAELVTLIRPVLSEQLRTLEQDLDVARAAGLDTPEVTEALSEARRRLALPVPAGVPESVEKARSSLVQTRGFLEHAERVVNRARDAINEAELVRVDVSSARPKLDTIEAALLRKEYPRVIDLASTLEREMLQATSQQVARSLAGFQAMVARARHEGSDTAVPENLLRQARTALEEGRPVEALQKASLSEAELERVELQLRIAQSALETMERKVAEARSDQVQTRGAEEVVQRARRAFEARRYPEVLEHAIDVIDSLTGAREGHRRARDALDSADRQLREARELGADVEEMLPMLDRARAGSQAGEYGPALRLARETSEGARWAIERLYAASLAELRGLLDAATKAGVTRGLDPVRESIAQVENALKSRDWTRANAALARAQADARGALEAFAVSREVRLAELYQREVEPPSGAEAEMRRQLKARIDEDRARGSFTAVFSAIAEEEGRLESRRKSGLQQRLAELKDRLWIGEKLGLDTTPVMELFSEAGLSVQAGRFEAVDGLLKEADTRLRTLVGRRLGEKFEEVQTELNFSRDGLHVTVEPVAANLKTVHQLRSEGQLLLAARALLEAEDELNRRKALHRELMNLHYLIDAALARATERHLDTTAARRLLEESIQSRGSDYNVALAKAREALQLLQSQLKTPETPTGFWTFRRPPSVL